MIALETSRLLFRDHETGDLDAFCALEADPQVRRYVGGAPRPRDRAQTKFRDVYLPPVGPDRLALWASVYKPEGRYIGYCGVYPHFAKDGTPIPAEGTLAFYLARAYWGRGLATEAGRAFLRWGFTELGLNRIVASVQVGNDASVRVLEKLGLTLTQTETGQHHSYHYFAMSKPYWERQENSRAS